MNKIKSIVENMYNSEYIVVDEPTKVKDSMVLKHSCGYVYRVGIVGNFLYSNKGKCPVCYGRMVSRNKLDEFILEKSKFLGEYTAEHYANEYKNSDSIYITHSRCNSRYKTTIENFYKKKNGCPYCKSPNIDIIKSKCNREGYSLIEDTNLENYKNCESTLMFKHEMCGRSFMMRYNNFVNGKQNCPYCRPNRRRTNGEFTKSISDRLDEYDILSEYTTSRGYIHVRHKVCGYEYKILANNFKRGYSCSKCFKGNKKTHDEYVSELSEQTLSSFIIETEYVGSKKKIQLYHKKCKKSFKINAGYFLVHQSCPKCSESLGERTIEEYLDKNKIKFIKQKKFDGCKDKYRLPFDFYIPDLNLIVEYDGEQHFSPVFGETSFKATIRHDDIKNNFCKDNNINILRIPYTDFKDINNILEKKLNQFNDYPNGGEIPQQE